MPRALETGMIIKNKFEDVNVVIDKNLEEMNNNTVDTSRFIDYRK